MNIYQGSTTSQGKIIPIKIHFASLIFEIITLSVGSGPLISIHVRFQSPNCYLYKTKYIIDALILSIQYLKLCTNLQTICQ